MPQKDDTSQNLKRSGGYQGQQRGQQRSVSFKDTSIKKVTVQPGPVDQDELEAFRRWKDGVNYGLFKIGEDKLRRINLGPKAGANSRQPSTIKARMLTRLL